MFTRKIILTSDVALIFGITKRAAQYRLRTIRKYFGKRSDQPILVDEFCYYSGCGKDVIYRHFKALGETEYPKKPNKDEPDESSGPKPDDESE
jgi:hypothetical protein